MTEEVEKQFHVKSEYAATILSYTAVQRKHAARVRKEFEIWKELGWKCSVVKTYVSNDKNNIGGELAAIVKFDTVYTMKHILRAVKTEKETEGSNADTGQNQDSRGE